MSGEHLFGVPVAAVYGHGDDAVLAEGRFGTPDQRAVGHNYGVPAPWSGNPGPDGESIEDHSCVETTKKGEPCRAPRAKGTDMCVGHLRSASTKES